MKWWFPNFIISSTLISWHSSERNRSPFYLIYFRFSVFICIATDSWILMLFDESVSVTVTLMLKFSLIWPVWALSFWLQCYIDIAHCSLSISSLAATGYLPFTCKFPAQSEISHFFLRIKESLYDGMAFRN